jgi:hypothetical protein
MAVCVIGLTMDSESGEMRPACNVHCTFNLPCMHDGEPAAPAPMHTDSEPSRHAAVEHWLSRTRGQRPLVIHAGSFAGRRHDLTESLPAACWCALVVLEAREA